MNSLIYSGRVMHARHHPTAHRFEYPIIFYAIDLDELPELIGSVKGFNTSPGSPFSLRASDYLGGHGNFRERIASYAPEISPHRIVLVTVARFLTPVFNPVNFYYLLNQHNQTEQMLIEVNNTFDQRHIYLLPGSSSYPVRSRIQKEFHVSPYNDMSGA